MSRFRESLVGTVFEDVADVATSVVDKTSDVATSVWDRIPGSELVEDTAGVVSGPVKDFADGPLKDFANTGVGETVMRAASVAVSMAAYTLNPAIGPYVFPWIGPTLAFAAWSIPGMAKGDSFDESLTKEFAYRVAYIVKFFTDKLFQGSFGQKMQDWLQGEGGELVKKLNEQFVQATDAAKREIQKAYPGVSTEEALRRLGLQPRSVLENMGLTPKQLAAKLGIREDMAALALSWLKRDPSYLSEVREWYEPETGASTKEAFYAAIKRKLDAANAAEINTLVNLSVADPCQAYIKAVATGGRRSDIEPVLKLRCLERKQQDALLTALLQKNPCQAYVESVRLQRMDQSLFKARCESFKKTPAFKSIQATMDDTSAKAFPTKAVLIAGAVLAVGGFAWFKLHRGS